MHSKKYMKRVLDLFMLLAMPVLMAYSLVGEAFHEWLGIATAVAFLLHHVLNFNWIKNLFRGRYSAYRVGSLVVNLLLAATMVLLPVSGILMSGHILISWKVPAWTGTARTLHLCVSYWGYLLMSFHLGMHWSVLKGCIPKIKLQSTVHKAVAYLFLVLICGYGVYAFIHRGFTDYLFLKTHFMFFDYSEPVALFLLDYLAVMVLVSSVGSSLTALMRKKSKSNQTI